MAPGVAAARFIFLIQAPQAVVSGVVRDADTRLPLSGAVVALTDQGRAIYADANGRYVVRDVPAGPQHVLVRALGHAPHTLHALVPATGTLEIDVVLRPLPFELPAIEVRHKAIAIRGAEAGDGSRFPDRALSLAAIRNDPRLAEPDALLALSGGDVVIQPESPQGVHIRGGAADQTAYLLDGIPVFSPYHAAGVFSAWNPDAIATVRLDAAATSPALPDVLSGAISATTRTPGTRIETQGSMSTDQARITLIGPTGIGRMGFLLSARMGLPDAFAPRDEASYLNGETGDLLGALTAPLLGGSINFLGYDTHNELGASARADVDQPLAARNQFEWHSQSIGATWTRRYERTELRFVTWSAASDASSRWQSSTAVDQLTARRHDLGVLGSVKFHTGGATTLAGARVETITTSYAVSSTPYQLDGRTPVVTAFLQHARALDRNLGLDLGASLAMTDGREYLSPRAEVSWKPAEQIRLSWGVSRSHQFAQSLRDPESVIGNIFPADLYVGAGAPGVPVARSDQAVLGADIRPSASLRFGLQAYARSFHDLLLAAQRGGGGFGVGPSSVGHGTASGVTADMAMATSRIAVMASYGLQQVQLHAGDSAWAPGFTATHLFEGGVIFFPTATASIRLGVAGAMGRHTTAFSGGLEWEACNLLDRGCEFSGSPDHKGEVLGGQTLPGYLRMDLGVRKHWHLTLRGRDAELGVFGTITNVVNRRNVMGWSRDAASTLVPVEMRPLAPLVAGLDWRF